MHNKSAQDPDFTDHELFSCLLKKFNNVKYNFYLREFQTKMENYKIKDKLN